MRAGLGAIAAIALLSTTAGHAATRLTSADVQATFFNGQPFTASTPSGVKFKMTFTTDGKVTREPLAGAGAKGEGTWKLDKDGFCTTWKGQKPNCYSVVTNGQNKWSIMRASSLLAVWSK
ncbi:MAG TPA: hypothetical protein VIH62_10745 [Xanthobacteraceae bacterium]|jgi:hypothetical protein